ncbi:hypothetical protein BIW11_13298 [Tropilaelaps mercedesae]|uniref:Uncharacterized protein n=1 Tax=Tropilaelaps mercedesae TaxID=418985 RepID=A0A1V9X329_9ACAR|nr:hypothetical protein BIW11_13298 [Tropilaelaps mercedesae]
MRRGTRTSHRNSITGRKTWTINGRRWRPPVSCSPRRCFCSSH